MRPVNPAFILEPTIASTFLARTRTSPEERALKIWKEELNRFQTLTFGQLYYESRYLSIGLSELGVLPGDRVALHCSNRAEWLISDLAIMGAQAISVPIFPSASKEELSFILRHSQASAIFVENEGLLKAVLDLKAEGNEAFRELKAIILLEAPSDRPTDPYGDMSVVSLAALREFGVEKESGKGDSFEKNLERIRPEDHLSITYTPGTTGTPKGVLISHRAVCSVLRDCDQQLGRFVDPSKDQVFSLLDSANVLSRVELYATLAFGWTRLFSGQRLAPSVSLPRFEPDLLFSSTAFFEKEFREAALKSSRPDRGRFSTLMTLLRENPLTHLVLADPISARIGGRLRLAVCAGPGIPEKVSDFFATAGVTLLTGYGSTETCGTVALNTPDEFKVGSAGRPLPEVAVRIAADGEILVKSEKLFSGYYRMESETRSVLVEGWFHTGDIGSLDSEGYLYVTDRKKDLLALKSGRKASPLRFERLARLNPYFQDLFVFGEDRDYLTALVTLDRSKTLEFAEKSGILFTQYDDLIRSPQILHLVQRGIEEINALAATEEKLRKFIVLSRPFGMETGELSRSRHLRRSTIESRFKTELESLYLDSQDPIR